MDDEKCQGDAGEGDQNELREAPQDIDDNAAQDFGAVGFGFSRASM
jgi:hypothetical protein